MKFSTVFTALTTATLALANSVTFISQDSTSRTIVFTPSAGHASLSDITVSGNGRATVTFPSGWIGNWYSVSDGGSRVPGMLGEVAFQGWNDLTYFDVSAIVNPDDHDGVKLMYPSASSQPTSGCDVFPCDNAYYLPDDVQTKTTTETDLVCTLGGSGSSKRDLGNVGRNFVERGY